MHNKPVTWIDYMPVAKAYRRHIVNMKTRNAYQMHVAERYARRFNTDLLSAVSAIAVRFGAKYPKSKYYSAETNAKLGY